MEFIDPKIEDYSLTHSNQQNDLLHKLERETHTSVLKPRMISGHLQGRILSMLSKMQQPKRILEIGTYTGFSALCFAEGLQNDGELITIDINEELAPLCKRYFDASEYRNQIKPMIGNALDIIPTLEGEFDIVFIDADKSNYIKYYEMVIDRIPSGGLIIIDNVLWSGKVLETPKEKDIDTQVLQELNKMVTEDARVENLLLPVRDGLMIARKK